MKNLTTISISNFLLQLGILMGVVISNPSVHAAPIIWTGPTTNFAQTAPTTPPQADVLVPGKVSLTRNFAKHLYNTNVDLFGADIGTPSDTEWAFGALGNYATLTYHTFDFYRNGDLNSVLTNGGPMVVHLINEDIYLSVRFTAWGHGGGLIAYTRSTPAAVVPPPTPSVTITNPTEGAVFSSPANVTIRANATATGGTITNVQFFANAGSIGSKQAAPFNFTANGLTTGSYALKAVATAGGISATSAVVNISIVSPVTTSLAASSLTPNNEFSFTYSATPGLTYAVDVSSNLFNWTPLATNVAASNPVSFTNAISGDGNYYRVRLLPNP
jgi:hypothetical protein